MSSQQGAVAFSRDTKLYVVLAPEILFDNVGFSPPGKDKAASNSQRWPLSRISGWIDSDRVSKNRNSERGLIYATVSLAAGFFPAYSQPPVHGVL
jgi:hypothetical protein